MWDFRSSSHLIPRFGDRPDRSPTRSPRHRITRLPIGASATDAVHQDDVDGQYPQSLMTSRWCPASNMSHWPRLGRGQPPCSCSAHSSTVKCCDTRRDTRLFGYRDTGTCGAGKPRKKRPPTWQPAPSLRRLLRWESFFRPGIQWRRHTVCFHGSASRCHMSDKSRLYRADPYAQDHCSGSVCSCCSWSTV